MEMYCTLIITRYPKYLGLFGFLSMALFRVPLWLNKKIHFWKLLGSGKNGTFDTRPDLRQWALLFTTTERVIDLPAFIDSYWKFFKCDMKRFTMQPISGHGSWGGKSPFKNLLMQSDYGGPVAVLTRATIRVKRLKDFWSHVDSVAEKMVLSEGFILSYGIGELPWLKQATFSVWGDLASMKQFAYTMKEHSDVIHKTRSENWYKEELFVRFRIISVQGFSSDVEAKMFTLQPSYDEAQ